jgi:hypothetical protein
MKTEEYVKYFDEIIQGKVNISPYDNPDYVHFTKLNQHRYARWMKTGALTENCKHILNNLTAHQEWILITEPWCGDAAHSVPFIGLMAEQSASITLRLQLRDAEDSCIHQYLTNGAKSIPKLIVRDQNGNDLFTWGPRPAACQEIYASMKEAGADMDTLKTSLQEWYNADKGYSLQQEIGALLLQC